MTSNTAPTAPPSNEPASAGPAQSPSTATSLSEGKDTLDQAEEWVSGILQAAQAHICEGAPRGHTGLTWFAHAGAPNWSPEQRKRRYRISPIPPTICEKAGRDDRIRTCDPLTPSNALDTALKT